MQRAGKGGAGGHAHENALALRQLARQAHGVGAVDRQHAIDQAHRDRVLGELGDEVRRPALHHVRARERVAFGRTAVGGARLRDAAREHWRIVRLAYRDPGVGRDPDEGRVREADQRPPEPGLDDVARQQGALAAGPQPADPGG